MPENISNKNKMVLKDLKELGEKLQTLESPKATPDSISKRTNPTQTETDSQKLPKIQNISSDKKKTDTSWYSGYYPKGDVNPKAINRGKNELFIAQPPKQTIINIAKENITEFIEQEKYLNFYVENEKVLEEFSRICKLNQEFNKMKICYSPISKHIYFDKNLETVDQIRVQKFIDIAHFNVNQSKAEVPQPKNNKEVPAT